MNQFFIQRIRQLSSVCTFVIRNQTITIRLLATAIATPQLTVPTRQCYHQQQRCSHSVQFPTTSSTANRDDSVDIIIVNDCKNNVACNALLRGFVNAGNFSQAIQLFNSVLQRGFVPDNFTYPLVHKACSQLSALDDGRRVQQAIRYYQTNYNVTPNVYVHCALIYMFSKCGSLNEARKVFDEMPARDLASWSAMISGTLHNGLCLEAIRLFRRMRLEGLRSDSNIVAAILPVSGRLQDRFIGAALHACSVRFGFEADLYVSNALIDMYCKCRNTDDACTIFYHMKYQDVVSWGTLIAGFAQNFRSPESLKLYLGMTRAGVKTNAMTATSVLHGLANLRMLRQGKQMHSHILKDGVRTDIALESALIHMYANCGSMKEAEDVFAVVSYKDITLLNSLMAGYSSNGDIPSSFGVFRRIWEYKLQPNSITLVSLLPICTQMGALRLGREIHGHAIRSSLGTVVSVGNSLIDMYGKCGCLELAIKVFNQMIEKNIVTYNSLITAHGIHGLGEKALLFFNTMQEDGITPNKITFVALLAACSHAGLTEKGLLLYNSMTDDYGIHPNMEHYSCMVDILGRAGYIYDACEFIRNMPVEPDINVLGSLIAAVRIHNKEQLADPLVKYVLQKNIGDSGYYVLLSNIYASRSRHEEASTVRRLIKQKGLIKKPGSSSIQIGHITHEFLARGMHPELSTIQGILESLLLNIMDEGYSPDLSCAHNSLGDAEEFC